MGKSVEPEKLESCAESCANKIKVAVVITEVKTGMKYMGDQIGVLTETVNKFREDHTDLKAEVTGAVQRFDADGDRLREHLRRHWQVYIALAVPTLVSLFGVVGLVIRSLLNRS